MNKEINIIKGLKLEKRQVRDILRILVHSILFQRELGVVIPRTVESECGINYLTLNDINTDKVVEEQLFIFENKICEINSATLVISFYQSFKRKNFFMFNENSKHVWEEWKIPVRLIYSPGEDPRKADAKLTKKVKKRIFNIIEKICERKEHLPPMGEPDDPNIIRYPFEISIGSLL
jgi:autophagy-related protein 101